MPALLLDSERLTMAILRGSKVGALAALSSERAFGLSTSTPINVGSELFDRMAAAFDEK
jgi:hypothetical protein